MAWSGTFWGADKISPRERPSVVAGPPCFGPFCEWTL